MLSESSPSSWSRWDGGSEWSTSCLMQKGPFTTSKAASKSSSCCLPALRLNPPTASPPILICRARARRRSPQWPCRLAMARWSPRQTFGLCITNTYEGDVSCSQSEWDCTQCGGKMWSLSNQCQHGCSMKPFAQTQSMRLLLCNHA